MAVGFLPGNFFGWLRGKKDADAEKLEDAAGAALSPVTGSPFPAQTGPVWAGATGTSFLPEETVERAEKGSPVEKAKLAKDPSSIYNDVYEYARAVRSGEMEWTDIEKADFNVRAKWVGLVHRDKQTPGRFMMRLRLPNGITNADSMRFYADCVEPYGDDIGVLDITTRQNIQLRGVAIEDADKILDGLHARGQTSFQSALDNVRNMVGSPLAGIDEHEMVDTRPFCVALNDLITLNKETGMRGNPEWSNMPRKFNIAISGSRDDFAHTHINDIGLQPCAHAETGEMGFNVVLGGYMSSKRVAESVDMGLWVPADIGCVEALTTAILRHFRDNSDRKNRQKARLMWLVETFGEVTEVDGHARAHPSYKEMIVTELKAMAGGYDKVVADQQPRPKEPAPRTGTPVSNYVGVHAQPQEGLSRVGVHVPVGRLSVADARGIADLADKYSGGEIRLTVEQNFILPNVRDEDVDALLAEPLLNGGSRMSVAPGRIQANLVSCTGAQFCGFALIETKNNAVEVAAKLEERVELDRDVRIHWTGCPNSCGQAQAGDIGLMGGPAKKMNAEGKMKAVPGVKVFLGGTIGETGKLQLEAEPDAIALDDLVPSLTELLINNFGAKLKPEFEAEHKEAKEALQL